VFLLTQKIAHFFRVMKNITLTASEKLIETAREVAKKRKSTIRALFREWLADLLQLQERELKFKEWDLRLEYANAGGQFTRKEMSER
jgi:hypothetical protein